MEMIERVKAALWATSETEFEHGQGELMARAAIAAMRGPTEGMLAAARKAQQFSPEGAGPNISRHQDKLKWQAMLNDALGSDA